MTGHPGATHYVVAIDSGSQSTKVLVVDQHGRVHASAQQPLRAYDTSVRGQVVHPDDDIWDSIAAVCTEALDAFAGDRALIVGVGLCTIRFCRALLDDDGLLIEPMLSWMDERVSRAHIDEGGTRYVTTSSGYIAHRLTGERRDAAANYQGVWPIDQKTWRWSEDPESYTAAGIRPDQLFELVDPGGALGTVTAQAALSTGLPEGLPVFATANDKAVEALGSGVRSDGDLVLSLGTYITAMSTGPFASATESHWVNFACEPGRYLYESGGIRRGMWTVSWWRQLLADGGELSEDDLNRGAEKIPPGSDGLFTLLDWLAPGDAPQRRGAMIGFDGSQGRFHVHRSILEGIALTMREHVEAMEEGLQRQFREITVSGGGSRSDLMMQIVSDVFGRPARRMRVTDAAGLGAAICAMVGSGHHADWDAAAAGMVAVRDRFHPDATRTAVYDEIGRKYSTLHSFTDPMFHEIGLISR
ncbi:MAG: sugar kinase [Microbacteriaceae bacterium]|nr:sugar kinase [Microbacteriaceae bacterium]